MSRITIAAALLLYASAAMAQSADDRRIQSQLKACAYYWKTVDQHLAQYASYGKLHEQVGKEVYRIPYGPIDSFCRMQLSVTEQKLTNVQNRLKGLPAEHADVKAMQARIDAARAKVAAYREEFTAIKSELDRIRDRSNWPDLKADMDKLDDLTTMVRRPEILAQQPEHAAEVCRKVPALYTWYGSLFQKYNPLIQQQGKNGEVLVKLTYFVTSIRAFGQASLQHLNTGPAAAKKDIDEALAMAEKAAAEGKPMFFGGGVAQKLGWADKKLALLGAMHAPPFMATLTDVVVKSAAAAQQAALAQQMKGFASTSRAAYDAVVKHRAAAGAKIAELEASLAQQIIAATKPPKDNYRGADKDQLLAMAKDAWAKAYAGDEVLAIRIVMQQWHRKTGWDWHSVAREWQKYDFSRLQAQVVVKTSDTQATIYLVHFHKAHLKGDRVTARVEKKEGIPLRRQMLLEHFE